MNNPGRAEEIFDKKEREQNTSQIEDPAQVWENVKKVISKRFDVIKIDARSDGNRPKMSINNNVSPFSLSLSLRRWYGRILEYAVAYSMYKSKWIWFSYRTYRIMYDWQSEQATRWRWNTCSTFTKHIYISWNSSKRINFNSSSINMCIVIASYRFAYLLSIFEMKYEFDILNKRMCMQTLSFGSHIWDNSNKKLLEIESFWSTYIWILIICDYWSKVLSYEQ